MEEQKNYGGMTTEELLVEAQKRQSPSAISSLAAGQNLLGPEDPWIETYSGKKFHILNPAPDEIDIIDIAHAEANQCRFTGHVKNFYSVAEHSRYVSLLCKPQNALKGLLHDASEAYISDISRPLKYCTGIGPIYKEIEQKISDAIYAKFGLETGEPEDVKNADNIMLITEKTQLLNDSISWFNDASRSTWFGVKPLTRDQLTISAFAPKYAEKMFLDRFYELTKPYQGVESKPR